METTRPITLYDLCFILFKRKWAVFLILAASLLGGIVWLWLIRDDTYEVTTKLMVRLGHEQSPPTTVIGAAPPVMSFRVQDINTELDILGSADLLFTVIDNLGLDKPAPPPPVPDGLVARARYYGKAAVRTVKDYYEEVMISVGMRERLTQRQKAIYLLQMSLGGVAQKDSNVLVIKLRFPNKQVAHIVLNKLLDEYLIFRSKVHSRHNAVDFFNREVNDASAKLREAESALDRFEAESDITSIDKQKQVLLDQIADAQKSLREAEIARDETAAKERRLAEQLRKEDPDAAVLGMFDRSKLPENLLLEIAGLQRERERLRMTELDSGSRIRNNRAQFRSLLGMVESNLRAALADAEKTYQTRSEAVAGLRSKLTGLHDRQMQWTSLSRQAKILEENYVFHKHKLQEAMATAALDTGNVGNAVIIERAFEPLAPAGMRKLTLLGIVMAAALFVALAWVSLAEFFDRGIHRREDLERALNAPVLGVLPMMRSGKLQELLASGGGKPVKGFHAGAV